MFQEFCQNYPGCNFFYTDVHFCTLFSEKALYCDGLAGPPDPKESSCKDDTKIILRWYGADLDLHLAIFDICEVQPGKENCGGASLDTDDANGYSQETITIKNYYDTTYLVFIDCLGSCTNQKEKSVMISSKGHSITVTNDDDTEYSYWLIGCFNGSEVSNEGLHNIKIVNSFVLYPYHSYCQADWL